MHGAGAATAARPVHVEEDRAIAFAQARSIEARQRTTDGLERPGGDVAGNDGIGHAGQASVPEMHVGAAHLGARGAKQRGAGRKIGTSELPDLNGPPRGGHHGGEDAIGSRSYVTLESALTHQLSPAAPARNCRAGAGAARLRRRLRRGSPSRRRRTPSQKPRRHFITISYDWLYTQPLHFAEHPLEDLVGTEVAAAQFKTFDYRTRDGADPHRRARVHAATAGPQPHGVSVRPERRGDARAARQRRGAAGHPASPSPGTGAPPSYALTGARARRAPRSCRGRSIGRLGPRAATRSSAGASDGSRATARDGDRYLRRRRRRAQLRSDRRGAVDQVRLEPR